MDYYSIRRCEDDPSERSMGESIPYYSVSVKFEEEEKE